MSETTAAPETQHTRKPSSSGAEESMVVRLSRLDKMLELAGEVIIVSSNLNALSHQIQPGQTVSDHLAEDAKDLAITSSRISSDLHNLVTDVRTVDMTDLFARFRRLARDTARRLGKAVRFEVEGEEVSIDKKISEKIYDPIAHQIRNAIAHGIEDEATRRAAGKDPVGTVRVSVRNLENSTIVEVVDDGAGIDEDAIRKRIVAAGMLDREAAAALRSDALHEYLFLPGFSTATQTSGTSGRGVGMDVVRNVMTEVNGEVRIQTEKGKGTTFSFILPLVTAVNISDSLLVVARDTTFAFPISSVVASMSVPPKSVDTTTGKGRSIQHLGNILPLFDLLGVFSEEPLEDTDEDLRVIIIEHKKNRVAYRVSDFQSPQKIVISEFDEGMHVRGLSGTATLSGRKLGMVVDLPALFEQTFGRVEERLIKGNGHEVAEEEPDLPVEERRETAPSPIASDTAEGAAPDSVFLTEVESMLQQLNKDLLDLEENKDRETADAVFRQMHSIKGNLTMYGADEPASVTHQLETLLERARRDELELDPDVFDALYDGTAFLEEVVAALGHGAVAAPPDKLVDELARLQKRLEEPPAEAGQIDVDVDQVELDATGEFYLSSRRRDGAPVYQARIEFDPGDQPRFLVAYLILRRIQRIADVLGTLPRMTDIEGGLCEGGLVVLLALRDTSIEDQLDKLSRNLKRYYGVTRFEAAQFA